MLKISEELFIMLCRYHLLDVRDDEVSMSIRRGLCEKLDAIERRTLYSQAVKGDEEARKKYLDLIGMKNEFRW